MPLSGPDVVGLTGGAVVGGFALITDGFGDGVGAGFGATGGATFTGGVDLNGRFFGIGLTGIGTGTFASSIVF